MKVKISMGNTKMGKIPSVSLPPIKSCDNCNLCAKKCYAKKAYLQYPQTKAAYDNNYKLVTKNHYKYFEDIKEYLSKKKPKYFRWHVSGDILNQEYFNDMVQIAEEYPKTKFLCFTKMYDIVSTYNCFAKIPKNLHIFFSLWEDQKYHTQQNISIARSVNKQDLHKYQGFKCQGNCSECGFCFEALPGSSVIFEMH